MRASTLALYLLAFLLAVTGCHKLLGDYTLDAGCSKDANRCVGDVLQGCNSQLTGWEIVEICASGELCAANEGVCLPPTCEPGERRCVGAELQLCNPARDGWILLTKCANAGRCSGEQGSCTDEPCMPGMLQCNGNLLQSCREDRLAWDPRDECGSSALCNKLEHKCDDAQCNVGGFRCAGAELQACNVMRTGWNAVRTCESAALCDDVTGMCGKVACTVAGSFDCAGETLLRCADDLAGLVVEKICATAAHCDAVHGECTEMPCMPGARQCHGATLVACKADSSGWDPVTTCLSDALCQQTLSKVETTCSLPACDAKSVRCTGQQPEVCNAGLTGFRANGPACATADLCSGVTGICGTPVCALGGARCTGAQPEVCNPGQSGYVASGPPCASEGLCNKTTGTCGDQKCLAGQLRCDPLNRTYLQRCKADLTDWEATPCDVCDTPELCSASLGAATCDALSCQEPACAAGAPRCGGTGADQGKALEMCNEGRTGFASCETCMTSGLCDVSLATTPFSCAPMACTAPSCAPTDRWCGGNGNVTLFQCPASRINTQAETLANCATNGLCELTRKNNKTTCEQPSCNVNDRWCGGSGNRTLYQCPASRINSEPTTVGQCATNGLCEQTRQAGRTTCDAPACSAGQTRCGGTGNRTLQMCNGERTGFSDCATCPSGDLCTDSLGATTCNASACLVCNDGDARCNSSGNYETCRADQKGYTVTDCGGNGCDESLGGCLAPNTGGTSP